jgi:hypothetical protein
MVDCGISAWELAVQKVLPMIAAFGVTLELSSRDLSLRIVNFLTPSSGRPDRGRQTPFF